MRIVGRVRGARTAAVALSVATMVLVVVPAPVPAVSAPTSVVDEAVARSPELSETRNLASRRTVVTGNDGWVLGTADGRYPAAGFHTRGEMGGFWTPSLKLLDGMWFGIDGSWIGPATATTTGWGYVRADLPATAGVAASRTDLVPDGVSGALVGLSLRSDTTKTVTLWADAHSELMGSYPWGETTPNQLAVNLPDEAALNGGRLVFTDRGTPPNSNGESHDWAAAFGSTLIPVGRLTGPDYRGPQDPAVVCPASGPDTPTQPPRCDDTAYGRGVGGRLTYELELEANQVRTVWFGVGGSRSGVAAAEAELSAALADPTGAVAAKIAARQQIDAASQVTLPDDPLTARSITWSKQMLAASEQRSQDVELRVVNAGRNYPPPTATVRSMRWFGAGFPDYPWLFGTDGEYTAYAAVAAGQFGVIKDHLRALRDVSVRVNGRTGKIVHEVTPDGAVFFGANDDPGNTDESSKFPSAVALVWRWTGDRAFLEDLYPASRRAMRFVAQLDADNDGWPEGLGNVERPGMGEEKLDNAVYTIRGYADLADLARATGDTKTRRWATNRALRLIDRFERTWWYGGTADGYADSLRDPGNVKVFQRHWIGLTPTDAVLPGLPGRAAAPLATRGHARVTLEQHEGACYTDEFGLFHTGTGPTSDPKGNPGASCDTVVSSVPSERNIFTLNSAIAAVSEGNYGRLGADQQQRYILGNVRSQLDPEVWEMPGMMPEITPSPDFTSNIERLLTERSMVMQAWGAYGVLWPVIHQWLGVSPDIGRGRVAVVPQLPPGQNSATAKEIKLGSASIDVAAERRGAIYSTTVTREGRLRLTIGTVLPRNATIASATLDGRRVRPTLVETARGLEARVTVRKGKGTSALVVRTG